MNITGNVLKHAQHIEDGVVFSKDNAELSYRTLESVFETLKGNTPAGTKVSTKVDGAPSVACATNFHGKTFVCYKSALESIVEPQVDKKTGEPIQPDYNKICYSEEDCDRVFAGEERAGMRDKMKALMRHAATIGIPKDEIWQGDFMFSKEDIFYREFDGEKRLCFHPNTLIYTISLDDPLATEFQNADYCVIWHTKYTGTDFGNLQISFDVDADNLENKDEKFLCLDANIHNIAGQVTLTEEETELCEAAIQKMRADLNNLENNSTYELICKTDSFKKSLLTFMNSLIKSSDRKQFVSNYVERYIDWMNNNFDVEASKKKTEKGKQVYADRKKAFDEFVFNNKDTFEAIVELQKLMVSIKELFEKKLNNIPQRYKNYVQYKSTGTIIPVGQEGFCVSDIDGNLQKIVSRLSFSLNNFDPDILKGWESDRRTKQNASVGKVVESTLKEKDYKYPDSVDAVSDNLTNVVDTIIGDNLDVKKTNRVANKSDFIVDINVSPKNGEEDRKDLWSSMKSDAQDNIINDIPVTSNFHIGDASSATTPCAEIHIDKNELNDTLGDTIEKNADISLKFKPKDGQGGGASNTVVQEESVVKFTYLLSNGMPLPTKEEIDAEQGNLEWYKKATGKGSWYYSYVRTAKKIVDTLLDKNSKYIIARGATVGSSKNTVYPVGYKNVHDMVNKLCKGGMKDAWNPSDMYVCKIDFLSTFTNDFEILKTKTTEEINSYLKENLLNKNLIGISLKKVQKDDVYATPMNLSSPDELLKHDTTVYKFIPNSRDTFRIKIPPLVYNDDVKTLLTQKHVYNFKRKGVAIFGTSPNKNVNIDYRPFGGNYFYLDSGIVPGTSRFGKLPTNVLISIFAKYNIPSIESFEDSLLDKYVDDIFNSGIKAYDSLGNELNIVTWTSCKQQLRSLTLPEGLNVDFYKNQWCNVIRFLEMFTINDPKVGKTPDILFNTLIKECKKAGFNNAPYYLISNDKESYSL